jgi:RNA polymerase sigma-70 factor (ECF subfamily)
LPRDPVLATEQLYKQHGGTVLRYAWHLLSRREDAEDATQATFLAVHRALAGGTAVLEPGAWVLRIARNECMGRLRQARPAAGLLDGDFDPPAMGGVEQAAELRDEMRTAQQTLSRLPVPEREAFVLREWLGLETGEVAVTLGVTPSEVDALAGRARRSLVLAVGGLEPAAGCEGTQAALEAGSVLDRAGKVHLLRCPICRGVRRALRPPEPAERSLAPVAARLATVLPGFASGGGGLAAALAAKASAAPLLAKTAALVAAALVTGGAVEEGIRSTQPAHHRIAAAVAVAAPARGAQALASPVSAPVARSTGGAAAATFVALRRATAPAHATRGGAAGLTGKGAARTSHHDHGGAAQRHGGNDGGGTSAGTHETSGKDGSGSHGDHASGDQAKSSGDGAAAGRSTDSGSGDSSATHDSHGKGDSGAGGSGDGSDGSGGSGGSDNTPTATTLGGSATASSRHGGSDEGSPPAANDPAVTVPTDASAD